MRGQATVRTVLSAAAGAALALLLVRGGLTPFGVEDVSPETRALRAEVADLRARLDEAGARHAPVLAARSPGSPPGMPPPLPRPRRRGDGAPDGSPDPSPTVEDAVSSRALSAHELLAPFAPSAAGPPQPPLPPVDETSLDPARLAAEVTSARADERDAALETLARVRDPRFLPALRAALRTDLPQAQATSLMRRTANLVGRDWSAKQATDEPDTPIAGDHPTAWAPKQPRMGEVTLDLRYATAVHVEGVRVRETLGAGAIVRVYAQSGPDAWDLLWQGQGDSGADAPRWFEPALFPTAYRTTRLRLVLDTDRVAGWNEIDAVELLGDGLRQWAVEAAASSSYADP